MSTNKELKTNKVTNPADEAVANVAIPATGVDVATIVPEVVATEDGVTSPNKFTPGRRMRGDTGRRGATGPGQANRGQRPNRNEPRERVKPEFDSKIIDIRRVTRVATGGRRYSFSVAVVAGDRKGRVGVGLGKGGDTALSVDKATREAKKNLIRVTLSPQMTIPHAVEGKYSSSVVKLFPAKGSGVVAGSSARAVIELAGIKDVCAKFISGSKNRLNNAKATIEALKNLNKVSRKVLNSRVVVGK
jgi:small subunit ribosomal protein S5